MTKMTKIFIIYKRVEIEEQKQNVVKCYKLYVNCYMSKSRIFGKDP